MYPSDWFLVSRANVGRVLSVEVPPRGASPECVALTVDTDVEPGMCSTGTTP